MSPIIHTFGRDLDLTVVERTAFVAACERARADGCVLDAIVAVPSADSVTLTYVLADASGARSALRIESPIGDLNVPTVVPVWPQADWLERRVRDLYGVTPIKHPRASRLVRHSHWPKGYYPLVPGTSVPEHWPVSNERAMQLTTVKGEGIHEIPVGPIHAGIIEPGHFRFFADGERIVAMEPRLFYAHRGVESLMRGMAPEEGTALAEVVSGDTAIGHASAYSEAVEAALGIAVSHEARAARAFLLEAERVACHIGDLGGMLNDIAFGWAHAQCQGLREELLRTYAQAFGNRLLRGIVAPGGVTRTLDHASDVATSVGAVVQTATEFLEVLGNRAPVVARTRATGTLSKKVALERNALGVPARASGVARDNRLMHPDIYDRFEPILEHTGDVEARFRVRLRELRHSVTIMSLLAIPAARAQASDPADAVERAQRTSGEGLGAAEGWRGECLHFVRIEDGRVHTWYPRDPSVLNWPLLPLTLDGEVVPDFPLINKSFNLSYAGNDL